MPYHIKMKRDMYLRNRMIIIVNRAMKMDC